MSGELTQLAPNEHRAVPGFRRRGHPPGLCGGRGLGGGKPGEGAAKFAKRSGEW